MGWSFRKSLSLGGLFRLNLSKGGVGVSVGVKGARVSIDPKGRAAVTVGRGGLYARKSLGRGARSQHMPGGAGIGVAVGALVLVVVIFALLWPSPPKHTRPSAVIPSAAPAKTDAMDEAAKAQKIWKPGDPVTVSKPRSENTEKPDALSAIEKGITSAPAIEASAPAADPWPVREGISGGAKPNIAPGDLPPGNVPARSRSDATNSTGRVWVEGYRKKDGTMVEGHWRER